MHVDRQAGDELKTGRLWSNPKMAMMHNVQSPPSLVYHAPKYDHIIMHKVKIHFSKLPQ
jgi:hypothetical protein